MDTAHVVALWLHSVAMVIVVGYYGILGRIVLPSLARSLDGPTLGRTVPAIERRALPLVLLSIVLFGVTGAYLLVTDPRYAGLGNISTTWATLMLVKHLVVVVMIGLGVGVDRLAAAVGEATEAGRHRTMEILTLATEGTTAMGAIVLLLTAAAQGS